MLYFIPMFILGDLFLQTRGSLPSFYLIYAILLMAMLIWGFAIKRYALLFLLSGSMFGFAYSAWHAQSLLACSLPLEWEGIPLSLTGMVASIPSAQAQHEQFFFEVLEWKKIKGEKLAHCAIKLRLSLKNEGHGLKFYVGDQWQLGVKLKRVHGVQNPGGFDVEAWSMEQGIRATGYLINTFPHQLLAHHRFYHIVDQLRQGMQEKLLSLLATTVHSSWLVALILGERNHIPSNDWSVLRKTGTNHLMAIAGLHIGIIAYFTQKIASWCWRRSSYLMLRVPAPQASAVFALMMAIFYSALAGFSIPTQRACFMLSILIGTTLQRKPISIWHIYFLALFLVLLINPMSILSASLCLSFATIALIIYGMQARFAPDGFWWKWGRVQWVVGVGLIPVTLFFYQEASLISLLANCIAIPWLSFFILPLCFLSGLFLFIPSISAILLWLADHSFAGLWSFLSYLSQLDFASIYLAIPHPLMLLEVIFSILLLLLPRGMPGRLFGLIGLLPLAFYQPAKPLLNELWLTLLDVGQGLSLVIQTKNHSLIYDTGSRLGEIDMGERVLAPYLRLNRIHQIDMLVVSHGDNDHRGGAEYLLKNFKVNQIRSSVPQLFGFAQYCLAGESWVWDGVHFSFIYPNIEHLHRGNDSSCVLKIEIDHHQILLTGDIEKDAEKFLVFTKRKQLAASVLIAPHHGSQTSDWPDFIDAVHPNIVLYAVGYRNRYHFPHPRVTDAYAARLASQWDTANNGMIQLKCAAGQKLPQVFLYRQMAKHYWFTGEA